MKINSASSIFLGVLVILIVQGCSTTDIADPRASYDPDAFKESEESRSKKLAPMMDSFAQHMWLSTVKEGGGAEK